MSTQGIIPTRRPVPDTLFGGRLRGSYLLDLEVVDVRDLAPHVRSVTVASSDLVGFEYAPGQDLMIEFPDGAGSVRRRYTIRHADSAAGLAELEFELYDGIGPATLWAAHAEPGDRLEAIGPRGRIALRTGGHVSRLRGRRLGDASGLRHARGTATACLGGGGTRDPARSPVAARSERRRRHAPALGHRRPASRGDRRAGPRTSRCQLRQR